MIAAMKKARIIVQAKDAVAAINRLGALGVLHIENSQLPRGKDIDALREDIANVEQAISCVTLAQSFPASAESNPAGHLTVGGAIAKVMDIADWKFSVSHILDLNKRVIQLEDYSEKLKEVISEWQAWGDFEPEAIRELESQGVIIRLYRITKAQIQQFPEGVIVNPLSLKAGLVNCAVISREKIKINFKEIALPAMGLHKMRLRLNEDLIVINQLKSQLRHYGSFRNNFLEVRIILKRELEQKECLKGMAQSDELVYLTGYAPTDTTVLLEEAARKEKWGIWITEPSPEDNVPTLIRNPRWISIVSPIFKFLEVLPDYREWDISPVFIIFFSLFFGMLIGDAGYGLIYMLLTFLARKKIGGKVKDKSVFSLFYLLSSCAIIWGMSTGTFFGQEWFLKAGYKPLIPALNKPNLIQTFCFFIGALHLTIAHIWRAIIKLPSLSSLSEAGWICVVWSVFLLAKTLILGESFPSFGGWLITAGISLVVLFNNPRKNILKILNVDLIALVLGLISSFGEVVSYIRLFAVGMAGVAIADGFNAMAARIGAGSVGAIIGSIGVVVLGHSLCLALGPLSVLVHGIRLNLLEFSGHANISWSGLAYKPLKE